MWFMDSEVESVTIPASAIVIGKEAFRNCKNLKRVTFANENCLQRIGGWCFFGSGIEEI